MSPTPEDILTLVRRRLKIPDDDQTRDGTIELYIDEIERRILNYTRQPSVPEGLKYTWVNMVIDLLKVREFGWPEVAAQIGAAIDVKIGDTSVKLGAASGTAVDLIVTGYAPELRRYRRMGWQG